MHCVAAHTIHTGAPCRRTTREDERARYRRDVLRLPGPIDRWISANTAAHADPVRPLAADEVRCMLQMQRTRPRVRDDACEFEDPEVFVLSLTLAALPPGACPRPLCAGGRQIAVSGRPIVLERYEGWPESMDAPAWTAWRPGQTVVFRQRRTSLAAFLRATVREDAVAPLVEALASVRL